MTYISIDCSYCFLVGRICPLIQPHFLWPLLKRKAFLLRLNKGSNFLQGAFWIWTTKRFSLVRECNVFLQCCTTLGPACQFSLANVKLSRIVTYRSKIIRVKCSLNWSYINLLLRIELWLSKLQLSVFLKIVWVFWLERGVPPLVIALNKPLTVLKLFCYCHSLWSGKTMVSVLHTNLISCHRVGFVLSCFCKSNFSCTLLWRERYSRSVYWALNLNINTHVAERNSCFLSFASND